MSNPRSEYPMVNCGCTFAAHSKSPCEDRITGEIDGLRKNSACTASRPARDSRPAMWFFKWEKGGILTTITIYKPNGDDSVRYMDPVSILIENGVLSFYWTKEITGNKQKIMTTLPFLIQHDMNGVTSDSVLG